MSETWRDYREIWRGAFDDSDRGLMIGCRVALMVIHGLLAIVGFYLVAIAEILIRHYR